MTRRHSITRNSPIFVDRTGNRRRWFTALGAAGGTLLITALAVLVAGIFGAGPAHLPGLPGLAPQQPLGVTAKPAGTASSTTSSQVTNPTARTTSAAPTPAVTPSPTPTKITGKPTSGPSHPVRPSKSR